MKSALHKSGKYQLFL